ncbi:MAG: hypothetical protein WC438_03205 [Candidatus Pacearchaeota archaeon]
MEKYNLLEKVLNGEFSLKDDFKQTINDLKNHNTSYIMYGLAVGSLTEGVVILSSMACNYLRTSSSGLVGDQNIVPFFALLGAEIFRKMGSESYSSENQRIGLTQF